MKTPIGKGKDPVRGRNIFLFVIIYVVPALAVSFLLFALISMRAEKCDHDRKAPYYDIAYGQTLAFHNEGDEPSARLTIIETDEYGRKLFKVSKNNSWYDGTVTGFFICQFSKGDTGYYYPDICYELTYDESISDERMNAFKERNDWNRELDFKKCKADESRLRHKTVNVEELLYAHSDLEKSSVQSACMDVDPDGKELYAVQWIGPDDQPVFSCRQQKKERRMFLIVVDVSSRFIAMEEVEDPLDVASYILKIKEESGWIE